MTDRAAGTTLTAPRRCPWCGVSSSLFTDADRAELERLLAGIQDAEKDRLRAMERAEDAESDARTAALEVGRWEKAYQECVDAIRRRSPRG